MANRKKKADQPRQDAIKRMHNDPLYFMSSKEAFIEGAQHFLFIKDKEDKIRPWICNNTQHMLLNSYFRAKEEARPVRLVVLKGRQQGCSTGVGAIGFMHMVCHRGANLLIATEEKQGSGKNIFNMYRLYKEKFPIQYEARSEQNNEIIEFGEDMNNGLIRVSGERRVVSFTYKFIHLSEAAKFQGLDNFMDEMLETVPMHLLSTSVFVESTAEDYGDEFHELWQMAEAGGMGVGWESLFIPWFVHEEYEIGFRSDREKQEFEDSLHDSQESRFGNEKALLSIPPIEIPTVNGEVKHVGITLENLKWRRDKIAIMKFSLPRFHRQYPTTAEEAFLTSSLNVLDRESLDWYSKDPDNVMDKETGEAKLPVISGEFQEKDEVSNTFTLEPQLHPIVNIFEDVKPHHDYIVGVDLAQGLESGDFSCGIVVCRHPLRAIARLRGFDGRRLDPHEFARQLFALGQYFNNAMICPENNSDGGGVVRSLLDWRYPNLVSESVITGNPSKRYGWNNNSLTKKRMVAQLQKVIRERAIAIYDEIIIEEAKHLVYKSGNSTQGANVQAAKKGKKRSPGSLPIGYYDDTIFALGGALLLNSCLDAPRTPRMNAQIEKMERYYARIQQRGDQFDENEWLDMAQ